MQFQFMAWPAYTIILLVKTDVRETLHWYEVEILFSTKMDQSTDRYDWYYKNIGGKKYSTIKRKVIII